MSTLRDVPLSTLSANLQNILAALRPEAAAFLSDAIDKSFDKDRLEHYLSEFNVRHPGFLHRLEDSGGKPLEWFVSLISCSRFLSEELLQHPSWLMQLTDVDRVVSVREYSDRLLHFLEPGVAQVPPAVDLATFRRHEILRIVLRDALGLGTLNQITEELSNLADAILQETLRDIVGDVTRKYGAPSDAAGSGSGSGFAVISLGKLGGRELNYSSDIDLQGTLGLSKDVPVGFQGIRLQFDLDAPEASAEQLQALQKKTEQYCVVLQTLLHPPKIESQWNSR